MSKAKEITEEARKQAIDEINEVRKAAGLEEIDPTTTRNVGNNGYALDQTFHLTGIVAPRTTEINGKPVCFLGVETTEGVWLSLTGLMGLTSDKGYHKDGEYENWVREERNSDPTKNKVIAAVSQSYKFKDTWKPQSRELYTEYAILKNNTDVLKDKIATFWGTLVRDYKAKKDSKDPENGWKKDDSRTMVAQMWNIQ